MKRHLLAAFLSCILTSTFCISARAIVTNCTITIDLAEKTVDISAAVAIREKINVALVGIGTSAPSNLVLRITRGTSVLAQATSGSFTAAGSDTAFGQLDLNTSELVAFYSGMNPSASRSWNLGVWDVDLGILLVNDAIDIMNNPYDPSMPGPSPIGVSYISTSDAAYLNGVTGFTYQTSGSIGTVVKTGPRNALITFPDPASVTGAVTRVNGQDGIVVLTTSEIDEGTNLYYTAARVAAHPDVKFSMTNYVHVPSSTNWYVYDPLTRTARGCATNENTGPQGLPGSNGVTPTVAVAYTSNGAPGSAASVTNIGTSTNVQLGFMIPVGTTGATGETGQAGSSGTNGVTPTFAVAYTSNGAPGSAASVTNTGTSTNVQLGFVIPVGADGADGATGATGQASTFPAFRLPMGGAWTDFELKASTNNFTNLVYFYISSGTNTVGYGDSNALVYFSDDYQTDVRAWRKSPPGSNIYAQLTSTNAAIDTIYVYPSHDCQVPWTTWMNSTNKNLVWSWVRFDGFDFEKNFDGTKQRWNLIRPDSWDLERITP